jgi:ribonucleotide reductase beta subunit family protein with ferritin-like domain
VKFHHLFEWLCKARQSFALFSANIYFDKYLQKKAQMIVGLYKAIQKDDEISLFKAMVASVYLESFLTVKFHHLFEWLCKARQSFALFSANIYFV